MGADAILLEALARDAGELGRVIAALWDASLTFSIDDLLSAGGVLLGVCGLCIASLFDSV